jgi:hypothetical protein
MLRPLLLSILCTISCATLLSQRLWAIILVDFDGDGVSTEVERHLLAEWEKDSPEAVEAALKQGVWRNQVLDLSGRNAPYQDGGNGGSRFSLWSETPLGSL